MTMEDQGSGLSLRDRIKLKKQEREQKQCSHESTKIYAPEASKGSLECQICGKILRLSSIPAPSQPELKDAFATVPPTQKEVPEFVLTEEDEQKRLEALVETDGNALVKAMQGQRVTLRPGERVFKVEPKNGKDARVQIMSLAYILFEHDNFVKSVYEQYQKRNGWITPRQCATLYNIILRRITNYDMPIVLRNEIEQHDKATSYSAQQEAMEKNLKFQMKPKPSVVVAQTPLEIPTKIVEEKKTEEPKPQIRKIQSIVFNPESESES